MTLSRGIPDARQAFAQNVDGTAQTSARRTGSTWMEASRWPSMTNMPTMARADLTMLMLFGGPTCSWITSSWKFAESAIIHLATSLSRR